MTLTPAYGRDYKSKAEVRAAFDADADFIIADVSSPWDGRYANRSDLIKHNAGQDVYIRYRKLTRIMSVTVPTNTVSDKVSTREPQLRVTVGTLIDHIRRVHTRVQAGLCTYGPPIEQPNLRFEKDHPKGPRWVVVK